jgi:hypothetical protein
MPSTILPSGIRSANTSIRSTADGRYIVRLYDTDIVTVFPHPYIPDAYTVRYDTGGYKTPTTARRMLEVAHHWRLPAPPSLAEWRRMDAQWVEAYPCASFNPSATGV